MNLKFAWEIFDKACEENKHRENEIQQGLKGEKLHAKEVLAWVLKMNPKASIELQMSAIFHDIDRIITPNVGGGFKGSRTSKEYLVHKKMHAKRSADYICNILSKTDSNNVDVDKIRFLIEHHDDNGEEILNINNKELDVLVASDTLSWFTTTGVNLVIAEGIERAKEKFEFMIDKLPKFAYKYLLELNINNKDLKNLLETKLNA